MSIKEANEKFEIWRKEQIASLMRTGHVQAAKAFEQLGSIHWMAWQSAWQFSRESLVIDLGEPDVEEWSESLITVHYGWSKDAIHAAGVKTK